MQIEPHDNADQMKVWLSMSEQELLRGFFADDPQKQLAVELGLDGLRSDEIRRVTFDDVRELQDTDTESYKLRIRTSKTGARETPISNDTVQLARIYRNAAGVRADAPLVDVTTKSIRRWVSGAGNSLADSTGNDGWRHLSPHDLRRTWATSTYYKLAASPVARELVMSWGGWHDESVFRENYLGREPDHVAAELAERAGLV